MEPRAEPLPPKSGPPGRPQNGHIFLGADGGGGGGRRFPVGFRGEEELIESGSEFFLRGGCLVARMED